MVVNWKIYSVRDLSGGLNRAVSEFLQAKDEFRRLANWCLDDIGGLKKTYGYVQRGSNITNATSILGLTPFYYGSNKKQLAVVDLSTGSSDVYVYDSGSNSWNAEGLSLSSGAEAEFANFLDGLFMVNYSDATRFYDGSTWYTTTNVTGAPKSKYIMSYRDRLYLLNLDVSGTAHQSRVAYSSLPDDSYHITWDMSSDGQWFDVSPKDGDQIMGVGKNFDRLLIFKENTLWRYDTNTLYQFPGAVGTNSHRSIQNVLDWTIYFHKTGIYGVRYNEVVKLSRPVDEFIEGVSAVNLDRVCAYTDNDHYIIYLGDINNTRTGLKVENCVLDLDVAKMRWAERSLNKSPLVFATYRYDRSEVDYDDSSVTYDDADTFYDGLASAEDMIFFGDNTGKVFMLDKSTTTQDGSAITAMFESPNYYFAGIHLKGELQAVKFYLRNARRIRLYYSIDDKPWMPAVPYRVDGENIIYNFKRGTIANRIRFKGIDNGTGKNAKVLGWDIFYTPTTEVI